MQNKRFEWLSFGTWGLGLLGIIGCIILYLIKDDNISNFLSANKFLLIFISLFVIGVISSCCYMRYCEKEATLTEKQMTIHLDDNYDVVIHGANDIEKGYDEKRQKYFYKLFYDKEK